MTHVTTPDTLPAHHNQQPGEGNKGPDDPYGPTGTPPELLSQIQLPQAPPQEPDSNQDSSTPTLDQPDKSDQ